MSDLQTAIATASRLTEPREPGGYRRRIGLGRAVGVPVSRWSYPPDLRTDVDLLRREVEQQSRDALRLAVDYGVPIGVARCNA